MPDLKKLFRVITARIRAVFIFCLLFCLVTLMVDQYISYSSTVAYLSMSQGCPTCSRYQVEVKMFDKPAWCQGGCFTGKKLITVAEEFMCTDTRLGNKMSTIAAPYIAALHQNAEYVMIHNNKAQKCEWLDYMRDIFPNLRKMPSISADIVAKWPKSDEPEFTGFREIKIKGNMTCTGYRQNWRYHPLDTDLQALRILFTLDDKYRLPAIERLREASKYFKISQPIFIGVHMRIGDLLSVVSLDYGYQVANVSYYREAFELMTKSTVGVNNSNRSIFAIATDSPAQAQNMVVNLSSTYNIFFVNQTVFIDFAALSLCNHTIISGGTFGFWAATLSGGSTIYYNNFSRFHTSFDAKYCSKCFHRPSWKPLV